MSSTYSRRETLRYAGVAFGSGIAGCTSGSSSALAVSNETATERALSAEESYLADALQDVPCLEDWGASGGTVRKRATVTERTSDGVHVDVTHPYWYTTERAEADSSTDALYVVTEEDTERRRGDAVTTPC